MLGTTTDVPLPTRLRSTASLTSLESSDSDDRAGSTISCPDTLLPRASSSVHVIRARWSQAATSIGQADDWDLPCLGRIRGGSLHGVVFTSGSDPGEVTRAPLLLYDMYKGSRVVGSMMRRDPDNQDQLVDTGTKLVIPTEYKGWFQFVENNNINLHTYRTIEEVAKSKVKEFVVHSPIQVYRYAKRSEEGDKLYTKVTIESGEVLTTKNVLTEWLSENSIKKSGCFCFRTKPKPKIEGSYLRCRDSSGRRLVLPFQLSGGFSEVGQKGATVVKENASYQMVDIARWSQMPLTVKLVCGDTPNIVEDFSGIIQLDEVVFENTVIASTLGLRKGYDHHLVEFPVSSDLELVRSQNWGELESTDAVESAILHCEDKLEAFVQEMKLVSDIDPDVKYHMEMSEKEAMIAHVRALPPTPILPKVAKRQRSRAWLWAKNLLLKRNSGRHSDTGSEDSDYEVIPFYLRAAAATEVEEEVPNEHDDLINNSKIAEKSFSQVVELDDEDTEDLPDHSPPSVHLAIPPVEETDSVSSPKKPRVIFTLDDSKGDDGAHDEDGYLLPIEFRDSVRSKQVDVSTCTVLSDRTAAYSTSHHSSAMETCSSMTMTRDTEGTTCSLNKSTETLLAPPSSGTIRTPINSVAESDYSPSRFDQQRLDAFLADSIHELNRRHGRDNLMVFRDKKPPAESQKEKQDSVPELESKKQVNCYLDKIFDCDRTSEDKERDSTSSGFVPDVLPIRSMSVPDAILTRSVDARLLRASLGECGYQTLDSGIWLSPRSALSDPYRPERDSATYRSTSDCSWVPPESVEHLSVEEVGLSLRYIGMKDHIISRFCEEQIDGKQLTELNDQLLTEGFPDLNALDKKKLLDFIKGWRPKKWGYIPVD